MESALPSKKIFLLIFACLIGVGAVGFAVFASKGMGNSANNQGSNAGATAKTSGELELAQKTLNESSGLDSDVDGLLNWEESLWGTNQNNPDSDEDGTNDGEEVKSSRDPLKAGPNDKLAATHSETSTTNTDSKIVLETTQTANISRDLFANYMMAKRSGAALDTETQKKIIEEAFSNNSLSLAPKIYSRNEIAISADPDLKKYGNALGEAFYAGKTNSSVTEIDILNAALKNETPNEITKIDPIIAGYSAILNKLAAISVPQNLIDQHVELTNSLSKVLTDTKSFRLIFEDPVVGLSGIGKYYQDVDAFQGAIRQIKLVFDQNGVTFTNTEYGYVFVKII